jgi:hypothetical protein
LQKGWHAGKRGGASGWAWRYRADREKCRDARLVNWIQDLITTGLDKKELPRPEPGAMCYMMSKEGYLSDRGVRCHPHLMFFVPQTDALTWAH